MKIYEIVNAKEVLEEISNNKNLPTREAYKLYLMLSNINDVFLFFESKRREAIKELGREENGTIIVDEENQEEFLQILNKIGNLDCEKEIAKVDISLNVNLNISPAEIAKLEPFINFVD